MTPRHLILATAGHVDHGKTALIKALTGTDTDRLPEEKARGITIDLGFAQLALPGLSLGMIDVPGHADFIRNMIAGLGAIDLALLVVAADDGWMPQTEEHWQILQYLGVRQIVVAMTKCDLGDPDETEAKVRSQIGSLGEVPIVRTSVRSGLGLLELRQILGDLCARLPDAPDIGKTRLFVDRVFTVRGTGTVVTGTLAGGRLRRGENVFLKPQNLTARIRAIQSHNQAFECALPATRTALNLPDLRLEDIPRGSVLTTLEGVEASRTIDVRVERSARGGPALRPLKNGSVIQVHFGSARFTARITLLDRRDLLPGENAIARLRCTKPAFVFVGDRFLIRDASGRTTIAGGVVLNPAADGTRFRSSAERNFLQTRAAQPNHLATLLLSQLRRDGFAWRSSLLRQSHFASATIEEALALLARDRAIVLHREMAADADWWEGLRQRASAAVDAAHAAHPERAGLERSVLRTRLALNDAALEEALVADLCAQDYICEQGAIRRRDHRASLPAALAEAGKKIWAGLAARPFDPPSRKELAPDVAAQKALRFLTETGQVMIMSEEVLLSAEAFARMKATLAQALHARGPLTASELRQALGTSRRVLIPFLERCDREGLTRREGDRRALRSA